ncbi:unnamed protein product [Caenorhabditis auriculariae]|uniref:MADF domain-containing protein n=1 Tax=Caenorhabditis auriculariae TaxID=2777116 RepID=A0A8S1GYD7_9PELO|nr:unnamed protein product [Caenorhabditis auriculariae]
MLTFVQQEHLIELIKKQRCLWDSTDDGDVDFAWTAVSRQFNKKYRTRKLGDDLADEWTAIKKKFLKWKMFPETHPRPRFWRELKFLDKTSTIEKRDASPVEEMDDLEMLNFSQQRYLIFLVKENKCLWNQGERGDTEIVWTLVSRHFNKKFKTTKLGDDLQDEWGRLKKKFLSWLSKSYTYPRPRFYRELQFLDKRQKAEKISTDFDMDDLADDMTSVCLSNSDPVD